VSELETPGLILDPALDLTSGPAPAASGAGWGSLREIGGWWGLLRFLPGAVRQAFSEREQPGGLPVVEPGQERPAGPPDVDFGESYPTGDHTLAAEADLSDGAGAQAATPGAGAEAGETVVVTGESLREEWLATHDAGTELQDWIEYNAAEEADQTYEAWAAQEQADFDAGTGPYAPEFTEPQVEDVTGDGPTAQASVQAAVTVAGAELGDAGLEAGL
jgi:hypothetical protein